MKKLVLLLPFCCGCGITELNEPSITIQISNIGENHNIDLHLKYDPQKPDQVTAEVNGEVLIP